MAFISFRMRDKNLELGSVRLPVAQPSAVAGAGSIALFWDDLGGSALKDAIEAVTLGVIANGYFGIDEFTKDPAVPASNFAQREFGLRVYLKGDSDGRTFTITFPTVDAAALTLVPGKRDVVLADAGPMAELVTELETHLVYPSTVGGDTQTITVDSAAVVGTNS